VVAACTCSSCLPNALRPTCPRRCAGFCAPRSRARADALAREQVAELSDVFVAALWSLSSAADLRALSEACMVPEFKEVFASAAQIPRALAERGGQADEHAWWRTCATWPRHYRRAARRASRACAGRFWASRACSKP